MLLAETYSITNSAVKYATDDLIVTQPISSPHSRNMLDTNFTVDHDSQLIETPRGNHHGVTATCYRVMLKYDSMQCQHNNTTHMPGHKLPPSVKDFFFPNGR